MCRSTPVRLVAAALVALTACTATQDETYQSQLSAAQAAVQSTAAGSAQFTLDGTRVDYTITLTGLSSQVLAVHIHAGQPGTDGPRRVDLFLGPTNGVPDGVLVTGSFDAADIDGVTFRELVSAMRSGLAYVNVHTDDVRPGEMRGQIYLQGALPAPSITEPTR